MFTFSTIMLSGLGCEEFRWIYLHYRHVSWVIDGSRGQYLNPKDV